MFGECYRDRAVFVTGDSGFKGSWLTFWLTQLLARITGYSLNAPSELNHFDLIKLPYPRIVGDIRDLGKLTQSMQKCKPEIVYHLAAQPLVCESYRDPITTYQTNVMGTLNLLEAVRKTPSVRAVVIVTSDKCYENREDSRSFRETDPMGGHDPYSSSKGCTELLVASYRNSFFNLQKYGNSHYCLLATVRAGNVIGGGDWGKDRLVPDIMKAASSGECVEVRSPNAVRPWQHVLEPLSGYLLIGQKLLEGDTSVATGWNFGPANKDHVTVAELITQLAEHWNQINCAFPRDVRMFHEAHCLSLDCSKATKELNWSPVWNIEETAAKTTEWYRSFYNDKEVVTEQQWNGYVTIAKERECVWVS